MLRSYLSAERALGPRTRRADRDRAASACWWCRVSVRSDRVRVKDKEGEFIIFAEVVFVDGAGG